MKCPRGFKKWRLSVIVLASKSRVHRPDGKPVDWRTQPSSKAHAWKHGQVDVHIRTDIPCAPGSLPHHGTLSGPGALAHHSTRNPWAAISLSNFPTKKALRVSITGAWDLVPWASLTGGDLFEGLVSWRIHVFTPRSPASVPSP